MFPKHLRVTVREFRMNPQPQRRYSWPYGTVMVKPSPQQLVRIGIMTPKRIDKRSSRRHHTRRILVEIIRPSLFQLQGGKEILFSLSRLITTEERPLVSRELTKLFSTIGIISLEESTT